MKKETLTVMRIVSELFHLKVFDSDKRNGLMNLWKEGVSANNHKVLKNVVSEIYDSTSNRFWRKELGEIMEKL